MLAVGATVAGTAVSAAGTIAGGKAQQQSSEFQAKQIEEKARQEREAGLVQLAQSQNEAAQYKRRKELALSTEQTRGAAGGFSATDPTSLAIADEIARYGTLQEGMAVYGGTSRRAGAEAQARSFENQAAGTRYEGEAARTASKWKAASTILGGVSTIATRFAPSPAYASEASPYRYGGPAKVASAGKTGYG